jgi:hypothetical protein
MIALVTAASYPLERIEGGACPFAALIGGDLCRGFRKRSTW